MRLRTSGLALVFASLTATACVGVGRVAVDPIPEERLSRERDVVAPAIPGVVAEGARWMRIWQDDHTADGIVNLPDGGLLIAQEQTDTLIALGIDDGASTYLRGTGRAGSVSFSKDGRLLAVQRTCTDPGLHDRDCPIPTAVVELAPEPHTLADAFADGSGFGRLNDLVADVRGGAYFTVRWAYHVSPDGVVTPVVEGQGVFTNGIILSPDETVLYVTNGEAVLAFDVGADGATSNRREFARLDEGDGGDGMTVDSEGRLYVTGIRLGLVYVFSPEGERLGVIETPRPPVSIAFAGTTKRRLYITAMGALDADGLEHAVPEGVRNTAMSIYRMDVQAEGYVGRPK